MNAIPPRLAGPNRRRLLAALPGGLAGLLLVAAGAPAADLVVQGCNELLSGEVGVREAVGNVGDLVEVPVTIHTMSSVDAFRLEVEVPPGLLTYVRTDPGDLTSGFDRCDGWYFDSPSKVRITGIATTNPIPPGAVGRLAVIVFQVAAPGSSAFSVAASEFQDDLMGYVSCADVHGTNRIPAVEWGQVKSLYRDH